MSVIMFQTKQEPTIKCHFDLKFQSNIIAFSGDFLGSSIYMALLSIQLKDDDIITLHTVYCSLILFPKPFSCVALHPIYSGVV